MKLDTSFIDKKGQIYDNKNILEAIKAKAGYFMTSSGSLGDLGVGGVCVGKYQVPKNGFPTDNQLMWFLANAEGNMAMKWVDSSGKLAVNCGVGGYDFPAGVHSLQIAKEVGLTLALAVNTTNVNAVKWGSGFSRNAIGAERRGGAVRGLACFTRLPWNSPYFQKLLPYYRDRIIVAWNKPKMEACKDLGIKLAMAHTANWYYGGNFNPPCNDSGWNHRVKTAREALSQRI